MVPTETLGFNYDKPSPGSQFSKEAPLRCQTVFDPKDRRKTRRLTSKSALQLAVKQRLLDLADGARDVNAARAGFDAVEDRAAAPYAVARAEDLQARPVPTR